MKKITKKQKIEFLKDKLSSNVGWAKKAALRIFENQEKEEKTAHATYYKNSLGFSAYDAGIMSDFCELIKSGAQLSPRQTVILLKNMPKYAEQLLTTKILVDEDNSQKLDRMIEESLIKA